MPIQGQGGTKKDAEGSGDHAGESTHFREHLLVDVLPSSKHRSSDAFFAAKSIRAHTLRANRGGLAMRLAVPVVLALAAGLVVLFIALQSRFSQLQVEDLKSDTGNTAFTVGVLGRLLIVHRMEFLKDNPGYPAQAEWKTGRHWLVAHGFVSPRDWMQATGFQMDEYAPASILDKVGETTALQGLADFLNSPAVNSEIVSVSILDANDVVIAAGRRTNFRFDPLAMKAVPLPPDFTRAGGCEIYLDYLPDVGPEPVVRGVVRILDDEEPARLLGSAEIVLRSQRHTRDQTSFMLLLACLGFILTALMALACWHSARRITLPMRKLAEDMQALAEGDYTRRAGVRELDELGLLAQAFNSMAERLRVANLNEKETSRLESDLAIARDIQKNLLPPQTPRVRGLDIFTSYRPAKEIGGDYYDFLPVDDRHMGLVIADASGKSIPAALVMSTTRAILRFVAPGSESAAETLTRVNSILSVDIPRGMFVTAYYVILDPLGGTMLCASAGHTPLLIARGDASVEMLNPGGIALGFDSGPIFQRSIREQRVKLEAGDRVLLYTDGVVECVNAAGEEYSERRLREFLRRNRELSSHDFVGALMADLERHRGAADMHDDTTIVTFKAL